MSWCAMLQYVYGGQRVTFWLLISAPSCLLSSGNPKGAMLTHGNVVADFSGFLKVTEVNKENPPCSHSWRGHFSWTGRVSRLLMLPWDTLIFKCDDCSERAQGCMCSELCFLAVIL